LGVDPPYEHSGPYWQFQLKANVDEETLIGFIHKPCQQPQPPISMLAMSRNSYSMKTTGQRGFQSFSHCLITGNMVADQWWTYADAAEQAGWVPGRSDWKVCRSIFLADTTADAVDRAHGNSLGQNYEYISRLFDKGLGRGIYKRDLDRPGEQCRLDFLMSEQIIAGDVDEVLKRLLALIEETCAFGTLVLMSYDWDDKASWLHSMELFARELMLPLNKAVGRG